MSNERTLYDILGVSRSADQAAIHGAYRTLMKIHHPDLGADAEDKDVAAQVNAAFAVLRNAGRRTQYDAELRYNEARAFGIAGEKRGVTAHPAYPVQPRPGRSSRPWLIAGLALAAAGAIAADVLAPSVTERSETGLARALAPPVSKAPVPALPLPISASQAEQGTNEFARVAAQEGLGGAVAYSELCFAEQARTQRADDLDFCIAFDRAATQRWDTMNEDDQASRPVRFLAGNVAARHRAAVRFAVVAAPPAPPVIVEPPDLPAPTAAKVTAKIDAPRPVRAAAIAAPRPRPAAQRPRRVASAAPRTPRRVRIEPQRLPIGGESAAPVRAPARTEAKPSEWRIGPQ